MIEFRRLDVTALRTDAAWWAIYDQSFPPTEREPAERVMQSVIEGSSVAFRAELAGETVGIGVTTLLRTLPGALLAYFAVAAEHRSRRIGGALFDYLHQATNAHLASLGLSSVGLLIEVEDPGLAADAAERQLRERRIAFYQRFGGRLLDEPYIMPPLDGETLVPMRLMQIPAGEGDTVPMGALARAVYFDYYGALIGVPETLLHDLLRQAGWLEVDTAGYP